MSTQSRLWGKNAKLSYLLIAAAILLFTCLGSREIWTQEHRWADIVFGMFYTHDFLHPSLNGVDYYDKPLFSYWLIAGISVVIGKLSTVALRLPSAVAGLLAIFSMYRLGTRLKDRTLGLIAGWLLLTTFYFVFWARTSSADMLNVAGTLFGVMWYFDKKNAPGFVNFAIFFLIMAVTALCKGLVGPVVTVLAILPDLLHNQNWKNYLRLSLVASLIPAVIVYVLPFWASAHFSVVGYGENGLYLVYRENILRYFQPFDHKGPIYTYFLYLPIYMLPWAFFFFPALFSLKSRWKQLSWNSKWIVWATALIFIFFTVSGSRRSYYVLPLVPFAILMTADWIEEGVLSLKNRVKWAGAVALIFFSLLFLNFDVLQPLYYSSGTLTAFASQIEATIGSSNFANQEVVLLDVETKVPFYLGLSPTVKNYGMQGDRTAQSTSSLLDAWPILKNKPKHAIFITRKIYVPLLQNQFQDYKMVAASKSWTKDLLKISDENDPVAFIPKSIIILT